MAYDDSKIDEIVLALLGATEFENGRVWKRIDFDVMDRLHEQGYITNPHGLRVSLTLTMFKIAVDQTSIFPACIALDSMNCRRGSTSSPISVVKI